MLSGGRTKIAELLLSTTAIGTEVVVKGWVRTKRGNKNVAFIALNDGSIIHNIQIVADVNKFDEALLKNITTGSCIKATGKLVESLGSGQPVEIQAESIEIYGTTDASYPLAGISPRNRLLASPHQYFWSRTAYPARNGFRHTQIFQRSRFLLPAYSADYR